MNDISKSTLQMQILQQQQQQKCKKIHIFVETCLYEAVRSLPVMP